MDTTYVPSHLMHVERSGYGWPKTVAEDKEFQDWLVEECRKHLEQHGALSLNRIYDYISRDHRYRRDTTDKGFEQYQKLGALYDHIYACVDRALRVIADQVWVLNESNRPEADLGVAKNTLPNHKAREAWVLTVGGHPDCRYMAATKKAIETKIEAMKANPSRCPACYRPLKKE